MTKLHDYLLQKIKWYFNWHNHPRHKLYHVAVLLIFAFVVGRVLYTEIASRVEIDYSTSQAAQITPLESARRRPLSDLTSRLLDLVEQYQQAAPANRQSLITEMTAVASRRKDSLINALRTDPQAVFASFLPPQIIQDFPQEIGSLLEQEAEIKGRLIIYHADYPDQQRSELSYELIDSKTGKKYNLHFLDNSPKILSGALIKAKGTAIENELVLAAGDTPSFEALTPAALPNTTGDQKTIVILFNFPDNTTQPFTKEQVHSVMFTGPGSVNAYYRENSFNQTSFSGDVAGWYTLAQTQSSTTKKGQTVTTTVKCSYSSWADEADTIAQGNGVNLANYSRRVYVFPAFPGGGGCYWSGLATLGFDPIIQASRSWINNINENWLYAHELGHNLGVHHARSIACGAKAIDVETYPICKRNEYGDMSDTMGGPRSPFHFDSGHKLPVGWLSDAHVQTVTSGGTYTVTSLESNDLTTKILRIAKPDTNSFYYVSFRQPLGFDAGLSQGLTSGANIHITTEKSYYHTDLIDNTPGDNNFLNAAMSDGGVFQDVINGITVTQASHDASSATVSVAFGPETCGRYNPIVDIPTASYIQSGQAGATLVYPVVIKNNDSVACAGSTFNLSASNASKSTGNWQFSFSSPAVTLPAKGSATVNLSVTSPPRIKPGRYQFRAFATDSIDASRTASDYGNYDVIR